MFIGSGLKRALELAYTDTTTQPVSQGGRSAGKEQPEPGMRPLRVNVGGGEAWSVHGAALDRVCLVGMVRDEEGLAGCSPSLAAWGVLSLAGKAVGLRGERSQSKVCVQNRTHPALCPPPAPSSPVRA